MAEVENPHVVNFRRRNLEVLSLFKDTTRKEKKDSQTQTRGTHESENIIFFSVRV